MPRIIEAFAQFFDGAGDPLTGGKLQFTVSGTNNTDKTTYSDNDESIPNTNPVILDSEGRCPDVFGTGPYRATSFTSGDVQVQQFDPIGQFVSFGPFLEWESALVYSAGDEVKIGAEYYRSLDDDNENNNPSSTPTKWEQFEFVFYWNASRTYAVNDKIRIANGAMYTSIVADNLNNDPTTNPLSWHFDLNTLIIAHSGGGTLSAFHVNELQDGSTYTLPAADSILADSWVEVELPDIYSASTPTVEADGTDSITDINGADTEVLFNALTSSSVRFTSDGISDWRI